MLGWSQVAETVGPHGAEVLRAQYGGSTMYIPMRVQGEHVLARQLGLPCAEALARVLGGVYVWIPCMDQGSRTQRDDGVRAARAQGLPIRAIAQRFGITNRQVHRILSAGGAAEARP